LNIDSREKDNFMCAKFAVKVEVEKLRGEAEESGDISVTSFHRANAFGLIILEAVNGSVGV
jgi:hypothetical protein